MKDSTKNALKIGALILLPSPVVALMFVSWGVAKIINNSRSKDKNNDKKENSRTNN